LALSGRTQDVQAFVRRLARRLRTAAPEQAARLEQLIAESPTRNSPLRNAEFASVPQDADSRLHLLRQEYPVQLDVEPIWTQSVAEALRQVVSERGRERDLLGQGLTPSKSLLFTGPPGVGKT